MGVAELYANMCGAELWNRSRLAAYMAGGIAPPGVTLKCDPCDGLVDLIPCVEDEPPEESDDLAAGYQLPELDPAPWYDVGVPESADFAGVLVLETKLSAAVDRRLVQNVGHGATLTRARFEGRTLTVRALLIGRTCCAVDYGLKWLTQALLGSYCDACDGCTLTFLTCGPSAVQSECLTVVEPDGSRVPYFREEESDEWERGLDFVRQMFDTGLLNGPTVTNQRGKGCGGCACSSMTEVEFTIGIGNPWMYQLEEAVVEDDPLTDCSDPEDCHVTFLDFDNCDPITVCQPVEDCGDDPDCGSVIAPPPSGRLPLQECGCLPMVAQRSCVSVPAADEWLDQALIIEITAADVAIRNLSIHAWHNPLDLSCCDPANTSYFEDCNACATLLVSYIPPGGLFRLDSVARTVTMTCDNVTKSAARNVSTVSGLPFEWFEVGCRPVCLGFDADCSGDPQGGTVTVWRAGREL